MAKTITLSNQKGGVGKTTTAHAIATGLNIRGYKTLIVDLDPQSNLTFTLEANDDTNNIYSLFNHHFEKADQIIKKTKNGDIIPGSLLMAGADMDYTKPGREYILKEILEPLQNSYDYIIVDTPPMLGVLTINALTASDSVIVPMGADMYSLQGLSQLRELISNIQRYCNKNLYIEGILLTRYDARTILSKNLKETLKNTASKIKAQLFTTTIREGIAIKESQALQSNIFENTPKANVTLDYNNFIDELLQKQTKGVV